MQCCQMSCSNEIIVCSFVFYWLFDEERPSKKKEEETNDGARFRVFCSYSTSIFNFKWLTFEKNYPTLSKLIANER